MSNHVIDNIVAKLYVDSQVLPHHAGKMLRIALEELQAQTVRPDQAEAEKALRRIASLKAHH